MAFSRQDARYEPVPITLDGYSAADMMADLGIQRRAALPLAGRSLIIPPPPPDINKRGPRLAKLAERNAGIPDAWGALYDPTLAEERDDGLGEGQMHRTGPNYRPTEPRQRSPPRIIRYQRTPARSIRHARSLFELGKLTRALSYSKDSPDSSSTVKGVIERHRNRSPHQLEGPPGDILAPLRLESVLKNPKIRAPRGPEALVRHHLATNPPVTMRAVSVASHISSRIVPDNPNVSHWNLGKLATAKGGYDYLQSTPKRLTTNCSLILTQEREANKINHAAPVTDTSIIINHTSAPIIPIKDRCSPQFTATRPAPPIPSSSVPTIPLEQNTIVTKLEDIKNVGEKREDTGEYYNKEGTELVAKALEFFASINIPDAVPPAIEPASKPHTTITPGAPPTFDFSGKVERYPSVVTQYTTPTELDLEGAKNYPLSPTYTHDSSSIAEAGSLGFYSPPASGNGLKEEDTVFELLHRDFYSFRKAVDKIKARISDFSDFENSLQGRIAKIHQLSQEILNEIEMEEEDMRNTGREIHAMRMKHTTIIEGIRAKMMKEEVVLYPNELPVRNPELDSSSSVETMSVRSLVVDAESTVRVKREKSVKRDMPVWTPEAGNLVSQSLVTKPQVMVKSGVQDKEERSDIEMADNRLTNTVPITETTSTENEQKKDYHTKNNQAIQSLQEQPMEERLEAFGEESTKNDHAKVGEHIEVLLSKTEPFNVSQPEKELIILEKLSIKGVDNELLEENWVENDEPPNHRQLAELPDLVYARNTFPKKENPEKVELFKEKQAETATVRQQVLPKIKINAITEDIKGDTAEKTYLMNGEIFKIQNSLRKDEELPKEQARKPHQEMIEILEGPRLTEDKFSEVEENERNDNRRGDEFERLKTLSPEQKLVTQDEKGKQESEKTEQAKGRLEKEYLEQQYLKKESHETARKEARRLRVEEENLVRDHLELVKLQEKLHADEKATREAEKSGGLKLGGEYKLVENDNDQIELVERGQVDSERLGKAVENGKMKAMGNMKGTAEVVVEESRQANIGVVKQQEENIFPQPNSPQTLVGTPKRVVFPYKIDLDLRPVFDYPPLRVKIQQFARPEEAIINDCRDTLTPAEFELLDKMPYFQQFLINCNDRHKKKMARFCRNDTIH